MVHVKCLELKKNPNKNIGFGGTALLLQCVISLKSIDKLRQTLLGENRGNKLIELPHS